LPHSLTSNQVRLPQSPNSARANAHPQRRTGRFCQALVRAGHAERASARRRSHDHALAAESAESADEGFFGATARTSPRLRRRSAHLGNLALGLLGARARVALPRLTTAARRHFTDGRPGTPWDSSRSRTAGVSSWLGTLRELPFRSSLQAAGLTMIDLGCIDLRVTGELTGELGTKALQIDSFSSVLKTARRREASPGFESHPRRLFKLGGRCSPPTGARLARLCKVQTGAC
jgi:hypothetical protein